MSLGLASSAMCQAGSSIGSGRAMVHPELRPMAPSLDKGVNGSHESAAGCHSSARGRRQQRGRAVQEGSMKESKKVAPGRSATPKAYARAAHRLREQAVPPLPLHPTPARSQTRARQGVRQHAHGCRVDSDAQLHASRGTHLVARPGARVRWSCGSRSCLPNPKSNNQAARHSSHGK